MIIVYSCGSQHYNSIIIILMAMGTLKCLGIHGKGHIEVRDNLLIACICFQVCETYEVVPCREVGMVLRFVSLSFHQIYLLINRSVQPAASSPTVSQVSQWTRLRPRTDAW